MPDEPWPKHVVWSRPVRTYWWDDTLATLRSRVVGHTAECSCGYSSRTLRSPRAAAFVARAHRVIHSGSSLDAVA